MQLYLTALRQCCRYYKLFFFAEGKQKFRNGEYLDHKQKDKIKSQLSQRLRGKKKLRGSGDKI